MAHLAVENIPHANVQMDIIGKMEVVFKMLPFGDNVPVTPKRTVKSVIFYLVTGLVARIQYQVKRQSRLWFILVLNVVHKR